MPKADNGRTKRIRNDRLRTTDGGIKGRVPKGFGQACGGLKGRGPKGVGQTGGGQTGGGQRTEKDWTDRRRTERAGDRKVENRQG